MINLIFAKPSSCFSSLSFPKVSLYRGLALVDACMDGQRVSRTQKIPLIVSANCANGLRNGVCDVNVIKSLESGP